MFTYELLIKFILSCPPCVSVCPALSCPPCCVRVMGGATAGDEGNTSPAIISIFNIRPMDVAWKESTSNGFRPPQSSRRGDALVSLASNYMCLCNLVLYTICAD